MVGYIIGGLALGGFPLTNGFATRWLIFRALPGDDRLYSWALMMAGGGVVLGYLRSLFLMLGPSSRPRTQREPLLVTVLTLGLALLCLLIGLAPRSILDFVIRILEGMSFVAAS
jgi:formate hydrogenlyase subunit 3/multisubunit Na+/H+ antiporter MnhD subunit